MSVRAHLDPTAARLWARALDVRTAALVAVVLLLPVLPDLDGEGRVRLGILLAAVAIPYNMALAWWARTRHTVHPAMPFVDLGISAATAAVIPSTAGGAVTMSVSHLALAVVLFGWRWATAALVYGIAVLFAGTRTAADDVEIGLVGFVAAGVVLIATIGFLRAREQRSDRRFAALIDGLDAIVWEYDPVADDTEFVSRQAAAVLGEGAPVRTLADWFARIVPDDLDRVRAHLARAVEHGQDTAEYRVLRHDGTVRWLRDTATAERDAAGNVRLTRGVAVDVTAEHDAAVRVQQHADIVANLQLSVVVWHLADPEDAHSLVAVDVNQAGLELYARPREAIVGRRLVDLWAGPAAPQVAAGVAACIRSGRSARVDRAAFKRKDGSTGAYSVVLVPVPGHAAAMIVEDVTDRWAAELRLQHEAMHDALTGLPNRSLLQDRLETALGEARRTGSAVALLLMDLDQFKEVNDTLGHPAGDELLAQVGARLAALLRDCDTVARLGGDEFAVLLTVDAGRDGAERVAERITDALRMPFELEGIAVQTAASIGIALCPEHGEDTETLVQRADIAMYTAKRGGRGHSFYAARHDRTSVRRLTLVGELRRAIEEGELELHFQPKVDLRTHEALGAEALVRWRHRAHGLLGPGEFIPLAEVSGLIGPLTRWVVTAALAAASRWPFPVAVNVSARNLYDPGLVRGIGEDLSAAGLAPDRLVLELTESELVDDPSQVLTALSLVSGMGVGLSIDDFGTGWSSLANLTRLPIQEVKVDRSFVQRMLDGGDDAVIVRSIVDLGHNLGLSVVAEGVEREATLEALRHLGCDLAQGFYVCPPLPGDELDAWLADRTPGATTVGAGGVTPI